MGPRYLEANLSFLAILTGGCSASSDFALFALLLLYIATIGKHAGPHRYNRWIFIGRINPRFTYVFYNAYSIVHPPRTMILSRSIITDK